MADLNDLVDEAVTGGLVLLPCPNCKGQGRIAEDRYIENPCRTCKGQGGDRSSGSVLMALFLHRHEWTEGKRTILCVGGLAWEPAGWGYGVFKALADERHEHREPYEEEGKGTPEGFLRCALTAWLHTRAHISKDE